MTKRANTFNVDDAVELPLSLPMTGNPAIHDVALMVQTADALGQAVVIWPSEDENGKQVFVFYAIERVPE